MWFMLQNINVFLPSFRSFLFDCVLYHFYGQFETLSIFSNKYQRRKSDIQRRSNGKLPKESLTYGEVHRASDEIERRVERVANGWSDEVSEVSSFESGVMRAAP